MYAAGSVRSSWPYRGCINKILHFMDIITQTWHLPFVADCNEDQILVREAVSYNRSCARAHVGTAGTPIIAEDRWEFLSNHPPGVPSVDYDRNCPHRRLLPYNSITPELRPEHRLVRLSPLSNLVPGH
jgi:hypothetical protein